VSVSVHQEEGNNLSMDELSAYLDEDGYPMNCAHIKERIHQIVIKVYTPALCLSVKVSFMHSVY
jgi:hypothetical protein